MFRSLRFLWALAAVVLGCLLGSSVDRLPIDGLTRGVISMVLTWNVSLLLVSATWLFVLPFATPGRSFLSIRTMAVTSTAAAAVAFLLHFAGANVWRTADAGSLRGETVTLGVLGALAGMAQGMIVRGSDEFE